MAVTDVIPEQAAQAVKIVGSDRSGAEQVPVPTDLSGNLLITKSVKLVGDTAEGTVLDLNVWSKTTSGSGAVNVANNLLVIKTGTTANSSAFIASQRKARFILETTNAFKASIRLDAGITNNVRRWGAFDSQNGVFFQLNGTTPSIVIRKTGVDTTVTSFNGNGTFTIDASFHSYEIKYNQGSALFYQDGTLIHTVTQTSLALTDTAHYKIGLENTNSAGNTSDVSMYIRSAAIIRYGECEVRPKYFHSNFFGRVQSTAGIAGSNVNSFSVSLPIGSTAENLLVAAVSVQGAALSSLTDNKGQTWTLATSISDASSGFVYIYYVPNTLSGVTTVTATLGVLTNSNIGIVLAEYDGISLTSSLDKVSSQAQNSASWSTGSVTTTNPIELLFAVAYNKNSANDTQTPGAGFASIGSAGGGGQQIYAEDQIVTSVGTYSGSGTNSASHNIYAALATFVMSPRQSALITNSPTVIKYGPCTLKKIVINSTGSGAASIFVYDGTSVSGNLVAELSLANSIGCFEYNIDLNDGLTIVSNSATPDFTVIYD